MRRFFVLVAFLLLAAGCSRTPDETQIREAIAAMELAVEQRQPREFMTFVAEDFTGSEGSLDKAGMHNLLRAQFLGNQAIAILLGPVEVNLTGDRAVAKVTATLTGGSGGWIPERGAIYDFETGWKKVGGEWRCISANWTRR
jgi:hypothetical protein